MADKKIIEGFRKDRRRKHHHWLATIYYHDGETFARVYIDRDKAARFVKRQKKIAGRSQVQDNLTHLSEAA